MTKKKYKYIYGPVPSWRLGSSLGVDPISQEEKKCSFDCEYCQLGRNRARTNKRKIFIPTSEIIKEIISLPEVKIDYITFSGRGEPTLAENLGEMILEVKQIRKEPVAVLTNSALLSSDRVRKDLYCADFIIAKLDASSEAIFKKVNHPVEGITFQKTLNGMQKFLENYNGKFALQMMFLRYNQKYAEEMARLAKKIDPDEIQLNTPLRPCGIEALSEKDMEAVEVFFKGLNTVSVYKSVKKKVNPVSRKDTLKRRGKI